MKPSGYVTNTGNAGSASATSSTSTINMNIFSDSSLFPALGPTSAKATVVELADFQCPYCALAAGLSSQSKQYSTQVPYFGVATQLEQMAQQGKIRFIYVSMSFLGQESVNAAEAGFCALDQGKFWQMHDALFTANDLSEDDGKYSNANLTIIAQSISGLDMNKFNSCLNNNTDSAEVNQVMSDVQTGVTNFQGTPSFFVNGQSVQASTTEMQAAINAA